MDFSKQAEEILHHKGHRVKFVTHRSLPTASKVIHLFRTGINGKTLRFLGIVKNDKLTDLQSITNAERKYIGRTKKLDLAERRERLDRRNSRRKRTFTAPKQREKQASTKP